MLPSPVDDHLNSRSAPSFEEPVFSSGLKVRYFLLIRSDWQKSVVHLYWNKLNSISVTKFLASYPDVQIPNLLD